MPGQIGDEHPAAVAASGHAAELDAEFAGDLADIGRSSGDWAVLPVVAERRFVVFIGDGHRALDGPRGRGFGRRSGGGRGRARGAFHGEDDGPDQDLVAFLDLDGAHGASGAGRDGRDRLLHLQLDDRLADGDHVARFDQDADDGAAVRVVAYLRKSHVHKTSGECGGRSPRGKGIFGRSPGAGPPRRGRRAHLDTAPIVGAERREEPSALPLEGKEP